jgi:hypothetical protein
VNTHLLIDSIVQQTMVFIAQLATYGGVRAPLAHVADQVFVDLTRELQNQGVTKKVIADMFGMALRTYHRRVAETAQSQTDAGRTVWGAVLDYVRKAEPVAAGEVQRRFMQDDPELVSGVLNDLVNTGLVYRSGRGDRSVYRAATEADFAVADGQGSGVSDWLAWLGVYRKGPATLEQIAQHTRLPVARCQAALDQLVSDGRVKVSAESPPRYSAERFEVPFGETQGWEAAILDHYQAVVFAICARLEERSAGARTGDTTGGSTWSLDVWADHPLEAEAKGTLARLRAELEELRGRIDAHNASSSSPEVLERVVVHVGQSVRSH